MRRSDALVLLFAVTGLCLLAMGVAFAQGHAEHHEWYKGLTRPDVGGSCCSEQDCRPVRAFLHDDGQWRAIVEGRPVRIPPAKIIEQSAPDGNSHLCMSPAGTVYCFVRGQPKG